MTLLVDLFCTGHWPVVMGVRPSGSPLIKLSLTVIYEIILLWFVSKINSTSLSLLMGVIAVYSGEIKIFIATTL